MDHRAAAEIGLCTGVANQIDSGRFDGVVVEVALAVVWIRGSILGGDFGGGGDVAERAGMVVATGGAEVRGQADFSPPAAGRVGVLVTRRALDAHLGGMWEFPGGKILPGESVEGAARREVQEETGLDLGGVRPLITVEHAYADRTVRLHAMLAEATNAAIIPGGIVDWRWVGLQELPRVALLAANGPITAAATAALRDKM